MNINETFPSKFLKASDLQGNSPTVTIDRIEMDEVGDGQKPILFFVGKDKGLVLNKTNANNISALYGVETDGWIGKSITLFEALVDFNQRTVPAIRCRPPQKSAQQPIANPSPLHQDVGQQAPDHPQAPSHPNAPGNPLDEEIPFSPQVL